VSVAPPAGELLPLRRQRSSRAPATTRTAIRTTAAPALIQTHRTTTARVAVATGRTTPHPASSTTSLAQTRTGWIPTGTVSAANRHSPPLRAPPYRPAKPRQDTGRCPCAWHRPTPRHFWRRVQRLPHPPPAIYLPKLTLAAPHPKPWIQTCWSSPTPSQTRPSSAFHTPATDGRSHHPVVVISITRMPWRKVGKRDYSLPTSVLTLEGP